ncbi:MAG: IS3 family transposase, partial [Aquificota bacterium]
MKHIDRKFLKTPVYGKRRMRHHLAEMGYRVGERRVSRLMKLMGLRAIYPRPRTSKVHPDHKVYPCLWRGPEITRVNQVWSS